MNGGRVEHTCADCGEMFTGNHHVSHGDRFCRDCHPLEPGHGKPVGKSVAPQSIEEYNKNRGTLVHVGDLMKGGEVR